MNLIFSNRFNIFLPKFGVYRNINVRIGNREIEDSKFICRSNGFISPRTNGRREFLLKPMMAPPNEEIGQQANDLQGQEDDSKPLPGSNNSKVIQWSFKMLTSVLVTAVLYAALWALTGKCF